MSPVERAAHARGAEPLTLAAAVQHAKQADEVAWNWLFNRFYPVVHRYASARLGDRHVAEDIAQEVFVAAVKMIPRLRSDEEPVVEAWFLGIARFKVVDRYRRQAREPFEQGVNPLAAGSGVADDPAELATDRLSTSHLHRMLFTLTEDQRDVLARRFVLDQSLEHIARSTGRRVGAVKALQHRGLAALQRQLGREARG
ncbi:MAG: sigma-70 family RNA polymerase sigma factor [Candidatus Dormibacteria bacterium]